MTRKLDTWLATILCLAVAALAASCKAGDGADGSRAAGINSTAATNAGATPHPTSTPNDGVRRVTLEETQKLMQSGGAVVVDVRPKAQYDQSHIKGSLSLPRTELDKRLGELPKDKLIIFYCAWPTEHQSAGAALDIKPRGIENTAALLGGWNAWTAKGLPTEPTK